MSHSLQLQDICWFLQFSLLLCSAEPMRRGRFLLAPALISVWLAALAIQVLWIFF